MPVVSTPSDLLARILDLAQLPAPAVASIFGSGAGLPGAPTIAEKELAQLHTIAAVSAACRPVAQSDDTPRRILRRMA